MTTMMMMMFQKANHHMKVKVIFTQSHATAFADDDDDDDYVSGVNLLQITDKTASAPAMSVTMNLAVAMKEVNFVFLKSMWK